MPNSNLRRVANKCFRLEEKTQIPQKKTNINIHIEKKVDASSL